MKNEIYIKNEKGTMQKVDMDYGVVFGAKDKEMIINVLGESTFEDMNNIILSGMKHIYESAVKAFEGKEEQIRDDIYNRSVQMYSLLMDKFYPEAKDKKISETIPSEQE